VEPTIVELHLVKIRSRLVEFRLCHFREITESQFVNPTEAGDIELLPMRLDAHHRFFVRAVKYARVLIRRRIKSDDLTPFGRE
jgi:hypothetical protein